MTVYFSRDPGQLRVDGLVTDDVVATLRAEAAGRVLVVADLTLGSWRAHDAAAQLARQLGVRAPELTPPPPAPDPGTELARRADDETGGDRVVDEAFRLAGRLCDALGRSPALVAVLLPRPDAVLERHDVLLVRFLVQALAGGPHRLQVVSTARDGCRTPPDWDVVFRQDRASRPCRRSPAVPPAALVPGVLGGALAGIDTGAVGTLALERGAVLVDPSARPALADLPAVEVGALASVADAPCWLEAFVCVYGPRRSADPWALIGHAAREFRAGARDLPLVHLARAASLVSSPTHAAVVRLAAQGPRLLAGRFADAAAVPRPGPDVPQRLRGALLASIGWGLTMSDRAEDAAVPLAEARRALQSDPPSDEFLSLLNISALNQLERGDRRAAMATEQLIAAHLAARDRRHWQIHYVNQLNLTRLSRRAGDADAAERHRRAAFATVAGVMSDSDAIHAWVSTARIAELRSDRTATLRAWTVAALLWTSAALPEAVSPRVVSAVVGPAPPGGNGPDAVADAFVKRLRRWSPYPAEPVAPGGPPVVLVGDDGRAAEVLSAAPAWTLSTDAGCAVLLGPAVARPALRSAASERLARILHALVGAGPLDRDRTVVVLRPPGGDVCTDRAGALACCLRLGVDVVVHDDDAAVVLDAAGQERLEDELVVRRGDAVDSLEPEGDVTIVRFKRYRPPLRLHGAEARVAAVMGRRVSVRLLRQDAPDVVTASVLRELERRRVVALELPADAVDRLVANPTRIGPITGGPL